MSDQKQEKTWYALLQTFLQNKNPTGKRKNYLLLALLLLGIILMLVGSFIKPLKKIPTVEQQKTGENKREPVVAVNTYEKELSRSLQLVLEHIDGISQVEVFINFAGTRESTFGLTHEESSKQTVESDREGGQREILEKNCKEGYVLLREAGGGEKPLLLSESMPRITGVLVVARGAENSGLRLKIVRAIQSALDLPAHRIAVLPRGGNPKS